jgi:DNA-binding NarL/FixJ family response regulator
MRRARIVLADDHKIFLEGLKKLIEPHFDVVGIVADGRRLLRAVRELRPDLIVLDVSMPGLNGFEAARRLNVIKPAPKMVFLSMYSDPSFVRESFRVGAAGYVVKQSAASGLVNTIRGVLKGRRFLVCPRTVNRSMGPSARLITEGKYDSLTARQREVLRLVAEGLSLKQVAGALHVSPKTAEFHKYNLMRRLGLRTTAELIRYALEHDIIG